MSIPSAFRAHPRIVHIHLRLHHWVLWWFYVGVACGAVALVNIFMRELTRSQDHAILAIGILFWALGGAVCWASEAIQWQEPPTSHRHGEATPAQGPIADSTPDVLNRQWQRYAVRDVAARLGSHHF